MKAYYYAHEHAYRQIKSNGFVGWGNVKTVSELGDEATTAFLTSVIEGHFSNPEGKHALDLGCGTGTTAFLLAQKKFDVLGIDISETAIEMGRELAKQQNLEVQFQVYDILELNKLNKTFDLIYDSHCLHCIVFDEDRKKVLSGIKSILAPNGIFVLDTMILPNDGTSLADGFPTLRFDSDYILWHKTAPSMDRGVVELDGQHWCAQRRVYPAEKILLEIAEAGFEVLDQKIEHRPQDHGMLRLVLR